MSALRVFLRFLLLRGDLQVDLSAAVPTVAQWRLSSLPKALEQEQVECLLRSCDRSSGMEKRDYAILLLLARLGLRAGEIYGSRFTIVRDLKGEVSDFQVENGVDAFAIGKLRSGAQLASALL